jgi:hypothetical protein
MRWRQVGLVSSNEFVAIVFNGNVHLDRHGINGVLVLIFSGKMQ